MPLNRRNHYRMLFVQPDAPQSVIKAAYRALAAEQQRVSGSVSALVTEAYTVLADAAARAAYDAQLGTQAVAHASNQPVAPLPGFAPTATVAPATVAPAAAPPAAPLLPPTPYPGTTVTRTPAAVPVAVPVAAAAVPFPSTPVPATAAKRAVTAQGTPATVPSAPFLGAPFPASARTGAVAPQVAAPTIPSAPFPSVPFSTAPAAGTVTALVGARNKGISASAVHAAPSAPVQAVATPGAVAAAATVAVPTTACPMCQAPREGRISVDTRCHRCGAPLAPVPKATRPRATAGNERRTLPRVGRSDWATMHAPWNAEPVRVRLRDLSADGISVYSSARVATGARIRIGNERFDLVATVVGCRAVRHVFSLHARVETAWVAPKTKQG
jgi:hypothetical protein